MRLALITTDNREDRRDYAPPLPWFGTAPQALIDGFAILGDEIEVHVISCTREHLESPVQLAPNITFHSVHVPSWAWLKTAYLGNILAVRKCLAGIHPDIVHGQGTERDCALAAAFSGYPNLITLHGNMRRLSRMAGALPWSFAGLTALMEAVAVRMTGGIICLSRHSRTLVGSVTCPTWMIPNAVDPAFQRPHPDRKSAQQLILLVGDLLPNKNQLAFLSAIAPLQREFGFTVRLAGKCQQENPYSAKVLQFAEQHSWCEYAGVLDRESLARTLTGATLLALPSLEENLPMVILEAMAAGLPVAASHVGGIPDLITDRLTGMLFDPLRPDSIRDAVRHLLENPEVRHQMAASARNQALVNHHPTTIARQHLDVYREALKKS